jgi:hypothetical protein
LEEVLMDGKERHVKVRATGEDEETKEKRRRTLRETEVGHVHYRDGRDSRFADAGGIAERVAFYRYN